MKAGVAKGVTPLRPLNRLRPNVDLPEPLDKGDGMN
jgi:hypothetical protein